MRFPLVILSISGFCTAVLLFQLLIILYGISGNRARTRSVIGSLTDASSINICSGMNDFMFCQFVKIQIVMLLLDSHFRGNVICERWNDICERWNDICECWNDICECWNDICEHGDDICDV